MAAPNAAPTKLTLEPNVPQLIALKYTTGKIVESRFGDEKQVMFSLVDGRLAFLSLGVAHSISNLQLGNREPFNICKRWNGEKTQKPRYDVWLTPEGEKDRAEMESQDEPVPAQDPPSELERQLDASLAAIQARKRDANVIARRVPESQGPVAVPVRQAPASWTKFLLTQTCDLLDVYSEACKHAEGLNVPPAVVRTVMLSAFIGLQKKGDFNGR